jgi:lysozyme family protein
MICNWFKKKKAVNEGDWKKPDFRYLWNESKLDEDRTIEIDDVCRMVIGNKKHYDAVEESTGVPWWFVAGIHYRESTLNFKGCLHNGQRIIGMNQKTTWVPKGRGPFNTWSESAIDAMVMQGYDKIEFWDVCIALENAEKYNGLGYRYKGMNEYSPYLFAGTNHHDETGKYVADGRYNNKAQEKQLGVCAIWLWLEGLGFNIS